MKLRTRRGRRSCKLYTPVPSHTPPSISAAAHRKTLHPLTQFFTEGLCCLSFGVTLSLSFYNNKKRKKRKRLGTTPSLLRCNCCSQLPFYDTRRFPGGSSRDGRSNPTLKPHRRPSCERKSLVDPSAKRHLS